MQKKAKIRAAILVSILAISGIGANRTIKRIESGKKEITIDAEQYKDGVNINNITNNREVFIDGLRVEPNEISINEEIEQGVIKEINSLQNSQEVLDYIKQIYVDEYIQKNGGEITIDNVKLYKDRVAKLYKDKAQNGEEIVRKGISDTHQSVSSSIGLLSASITKGEEYSCEEAIFDGSSYKNVYDKDEIVLEDEETVLQNVGAIIEHGIDYYSGFVDEQEKDIYKQRLIDAVIEYKHAKIQDIVEPSISNNTQQIEEEEL